MRRNTWRAILNEAQTQIYNKKNEKNSKRERIMYYEKVIAEKNRRKKLRDFLFFIDGRR